MKTLPQFQAQIMFIDVSVGAPSNVNLPPGGRVTHAVPLIGSPVLAATSSLGAIGKQRVMLVVETQIGEVSVGTQTMGARPDA